MYDYKESRKVAEKLGTELCINQTFEEMGELTQELSKKIRAIKKDATLRKAESDIDEAIVEEIADVEICLQQLRVVLNINEESIIKFKDFKIGRAKHKLNLK